MDLSWETLLGAIGGVIAPGALWVGTIQQRVASSEAKHAEHIENMEKISARLDEQIKVSSNTNAAVGQINGKLDILVAKHISDARSD